LGGILGKEKSTRSIRRQQGGANQYVCRHNSTGKSCNIETDNESCGHITKFNYLR